jgi:hypothetical protein
VGPGAQQSGLAGARLAHLPRVGPGLWEGRPVTRGREEGVLRGTRGRPGRTSHWGLQCGPGGGGWGWHRQGGPRAPRGTAAWGSPARHEAGARPRGLRPVHGRRRGSRMPTGLGARERARVPGGAAAVGGEGASCNMSTKGAGHMGAPLPPGDAGRVGGQAGAAARPRRGVRARGAPPRCRRGRPRKGAAPAAAVRRRAARVRACAAAGGAKQGGSVSRLLGVGGY